MKTKRDLYLKDNLDCAYILMGEYSRSELIIPKGTRVTALCADGTNRNDGKYFIDDLRWIPVNDPCLKWDATYRGIVVNAEDVEE